MNRSDFILPAKTLKKLKESDVNTTFICNCILYEKEVAGIIMVCNNTLFQKHDIENQINKGPTYKLRIINTLLSEKKRVYIFEFETSFGSNSVFKLHLNPGTREFTKLCLLVLKNDMLSIHFENIDTKLTISIHYPLDLEDIKWFERNLGLSYKMGLNTSFDILSNHVIEINQDPNTEFFVSNKKIKFAVF